MTMNTITLMEKIYNYKPNKKTSGAFSRSSACRISCYLSSLDTAGKTATGE